MVTKQVKAGSKETATAPTRSAESEPSLNLPGAPPPGAPRLPAARGGRHRARQGCRRRSRTLRQAVATAGGHRLLGAARGGSFHEPSASLPRAFPQAVDASSALQRQMAEQGGAASSVAGGLEFRACPQEPSPSLLGALLQVAEGLEFKPALPAPKLPAAKPTGLQGLLASLDGEMQPRCSRDAAEGRPRCRDWCSRASRLCRFPLSSLGPPADLRAPSAGASLPRHRQEEDVDDGEVAARLGQLQE